jgi:trafficking protein particle complex subunit 11
MESYPPDYIDHNLPLVVLSGLAETPTTQKDDYDKFLELYGNSGPIVSSSSPPVHSDIAQQLLEELLSAGTRQLSWNAAAGRSKDGLIGFRIEAVGRVG